MGLRYYDQFVLLETKFTSLRRHGVVIVTIAVKLGQVTFFGLCGIYHDIDWLRSGAFWFQKMRHIVLFFEMSLVSSRYVVNHLFNVGRLS